MKVSSFLWYFIIQSRCCYYFITNHQYRCYFKHPMMDENVLYKVSHYHINWLFFRILSPGCYYVCNTNHTFFQAFALTFSCVLVLVNMTVVLIASLMEGDVFLAPRFLFHLALSMTRSRLYGVAYRMFIYNYI